MPEISRFYGIIISMNWWEPRHHTAHIHVHYGELQATIAIDTGEILGGTLTSRSLHMVREWVDLHRAELNDLWRLAQERKPLYGIDPLA